MHNEKVIWYVSARKEWLWSYNSVFDLVPKVWWPENNAEEDFV